MIQILVNRFDANRESLRQGFLVAYPDSYVGIVKATIAAITSEEDYDDDDLNLDPTRITVIDHGDYQGTILFVIAAKGYQPSRFWTVDISYGSCSYCDTFQAITDNDSRDYDDREHPTETQANEYLTLALHIVQRIRSTYNETN